MNNSHQSSRIRLKINKSIVPGAATNTAQKIMTLDGSTAISSLTAFSDILAAYMDMYRYFKINRLTVRVQSEDEQSSLYLPLILAHVVPGNTADPTSMEQIETKNQTITFTDPAHFSPLVLGAGTFKSISDWFVTQNDASSEVIYSAGEIWITAPPSTTTWSAFSTFYVFADIDITFRSLLDPGLISAKMKKDLPPPLETPSPSSRNTSHSDEIRSHENCHCVHCSNK